MAPGSRAFENNSFYGEADRKSPKMQYNVLEQRTMDYVT